MTWTALAAGLTVLAAIFIAFCLGFAFGAAFVVYAVATQQAIVTPRLPPARIPKVCACCKVPDTFYCRCVGGPNIIPSGPEECIIHGPLKDRKH